MVVTSAVPVLPPDPDLLTPALERTFRGHRAAVLSVGISSSLGQVAAGAADGAVLLWHTKPGVSALRFAGHRGPVHAARFCPSGRYLATAGADGTVRLWEPSARGGKSLTLKGHGKGVRSVAFSPDGQLLLTASDDKSVKLWAVANRKFRGGLQGHSHWVRSAVFGPGAKTVLSGGDDRTAKLWDLETRACTATFQGHREAVTAVDFRPGDAHCVATSSLDRAIRVWDARSRQLVQHYPAHTGPAHSLQFHHSGDFVLSSSEDGTVKIWDVREGRLLFAVHGHETGAVAQAAFSPDAEQALFASAGKQDQLVKVWRSNLGCYAKRPPTLAARSPERSQPQPRRPVSAPPLQRVLHYHSQEELLPGLPRRVPRPAYQRPTPPATHDAAPEEGLWQQDQQQETQQYWGEQGGGGGGDDAPTAAQTMKGLTGRGGSGDGGTQQQRWRPSTLRRTRQRQLQEGGLDVEEGEDGNGWATTMRKGGGAAVAAAAAAPILVAPSAPPLEEEEEEDEEVPRQHRPPRPDSAGVAAARETTSEARLQQTLQAMSQTMQLMAERLALVEDRLAGVAQISPAPTVQLPVSMGGGTGWLSTETGGGREGMPK